MPLPYELSPQVIIAAYERMGSFANPFDRYFTRTPNPIVGDTIRYDVVTFSTEMADLVARHAPAPRGEVPVRHVVTYQAPSVKRSLKLPPEVLDARRSGTLSESGREMIVAEAIRNIRIAIDRRVAWLQAQWLTFGGLLTSAGVAINTTNVLNGTVYLDYSASKNVTPMSVSLGIDSDHADLLVGASWATASTNIRADLDAARLVVQQDSGVDPTLVLLNTNTMSHILGNSAAQNSVDFNNEVNRLGAFNEFRIWGYTFRPINDMWASQLHTAAATVAAMNYFLPNNLVVLMPEDNTAAGRAMFECNPSDWQADPDARGIYAWIDREAEHPHAEIPALEYTGGPSLAHPDTHYVFADVTDATP